MYIGDTSDGTGLHHMVFEVVDNAMMKHWRGTVTISLSPFTPTTRSRSPTTGVAFPQDKVRRQARAEAICGRDCHVRPSCRWQVQSEFLQGLGWFAWRRCFLRQCTVQVAAPDHSSWRQEIRDGIPSWSRRRSPGRNPEWSRGIAPEGYSDTEKRGTEVHFMADDEIFENVEFHYDIIAKRLRELSFLNNGVKIRLIDQRNVKERRLRLLGRRQGLRRIHQPDQDRAASGGVSLCRGVGTERRQHRCRSRHA